MRVAVASLSMILVGLAACYDFSLPQEGAGGSGADGQTGGGGASAGGASAHGGAGAAGGSGSFPPPCDQWSCEQCAVCVVDFFAGDVAACEAYDSCVAGCMGSGTCEAGCQGTHPTGLLLRGYLDNQCSGVCPGPPPCGG